MNILVYCVHSRLVLCAKTGNTLSRKDLITILGRDYHIPKELREKFISELKQNKVILKSGKGYYIINRQLRH